MNTEREYLFAFRILGREILSLGLVNTERDRDDTSLISPPAKKPMPEIAEKTDQPLFVVNSLFLHECFEVLTQTEEENLHVVTGSATENLRTLERIIPLQLCLQSVTGAAADDHSLANELMRLYDFGLLPLGYFHSHPGTGQAATVPSSTDRNTQMAMEKSGSEILGCIFSRDGFLRFYTMKKEPQIRVIGNKIQEIDTHVYQLEID